MKLVKALNLLSFILCVANLVLSFHLVFIVQVQHAGVVSQALVSAMFIGIAIMNLRVIQDET